MKQQQCPLSAGIDAIGRSFVGGRGLRGLCILAGLFDRNLSLRSRNDLIALLWSPGIDNQGMTRLRLCVL
jgi:hypothetical protein